MPEDAGWYYAQDGRAVGPMTLAELRQRLPTIGGPQTLVYGPGAAEWIEARHVAALVGEAPRRRRCIRRAPAVRMKSTTRSSAPRCSTSR